MQTRKETLTIAIKELIHVWKEWRFDRELHDLTEDFKNAVIRTCELYRRGDIPAELRKIDKLVEELHREWNFLANTMDSTPEGQPVYPRPEFWRALEMIDAEATRTIVQKKSYPRPEGQLLRDAALPGMTEPQLCRMYGFTSDGTGRGKPDHGQLHAALDDPKAYFAAHPEWKWPEQRRDEIRDEEQQQREAELMVQWRRRVKSAEAMAKGAQETIEELLELPNITAKQICRMKRVDGRPMTLQELTEYCEARGLETPPWEAAGIGVGDSDEETPLRPLRPLPPRNDPETDATGEATDDHMSLQTILEAAGPLTLEQQIITLHQMGGITKEQIAEAVTLANPGSPVNSSKVGKVLARFAREPQAFGLPAEAVEFP